MQIHTNKRTQVHSAQSSLINALGCFAALSIYGTLAKFTGAVIAKKRFKLEVIILGSSQYIKQGA